MEWGIIIIIIIIIFLNISSFDGCSSLIGGHENAAVAASDI